MPEVVRDRCNNTRGSKGCPRLLETDITIGGAAKDVV